ncbi:hypothetical protein IEQ34_007503 [Dendrobium chrysotoxum]|uniref:DNA mismatch repair protein MutS-like N-terminal domain-containing protein n=1 Tax=Dendrobium chrysotoxum TaxID=161865 RepID=A0AAV7H391_DENCH|nr:hypothetical protein IEQ34_007503 [Dendrobium chrysotoxum]
MVAVSLSFHGNSLNIGGIFDGHVRLITGKVQNCRKVEVNRRKSSSAMGDFSVKVIASNLSDAPEGRANNMEAVWTLHITSLQGITISKAAQLVFEGTIGDELLFDVNITYIESLSTVSMDKRRSMHRRHYCRSLKLSNEVPKITRRPSKLNILCEEADHSHIRWWKEKLLMFKKPSSLQLVKRLVYTNLLGLDVTLKNGSLKEGTLNLEILQFKSRFPREVLLCRVGEFYEAIGIDACILVEHAGLNPCGGLQSDCIPKAGCPVVNLRQTLDELTRNGFSVCIVEEVQAPIQARSRKGRFISGHAHPGSPYVFGLSGADHDVDFPEPMPVIGISRSAKGYCMISVLEPMKTFSEEDGLTEEAIVAKLRTCQCHHLFLHTSLRNNSSGTFRWGEYGEGGLLWGECNGKPFEWFDGIPVEELLFKVREIYGLDEDVSFRNVTFRSEKRPKPLYLGTATQVGVIQTEGIPSLLKVLLPSNSFGLPSLYIKDLLLNPPTYEIASAIQEACRRMRCLTCSIPEFTCLSAAKLVKLLESKEANHIEFCRIKNVVDEILQMHRNTELSEILHILLEPAWLATGLKVDYDILVHVNIFLSLAVDLSFSASIFMS